MTESERLNWISIGYTVRYEYELLPACEVIPILQFNNDPDSYLSRDSIGEELQRLKEKGFRWIRTDGDFCVFERIYLAKPDKEKTDES